MVIVKTESMGTLVVVPRNLWVKIATKTTILASTTLVKTEGFAFDRKITGGYLS